MTTARVTSKGQVTIPKEVRDKLGIRPGEDIDFTEEQGVFCIRKARGKSPFDKWVGKLAHLKGTGSDAIVNDLWGA